MAEDNTGLSQSDFRRLLETPAHTSNNTGVLGGGVLRRAPTKKRTHKQPKKHSQNPANKKPKYRDRAAERRNGTADTHNEDMLAQLPHSDNKLSAYEQSKYLGGDAEHTHLVRGLDYLLLEKMRAPGDDDDDDDELERLQQQGREVSAMGAAVAKAALRKHTSAGIVANEMFLPHRMCFEFALAGDNWEIPTARIRSKDETVAGGAERRVTRTDVEVVASVARSIARARERRITAKRKAKETQEARQEEAQEREVVPTAEDAEGNTFSDGDIFEDAGTDYEVTVEAQSAVAGPERPPEDYGDLSDGAYPGGDERSGDLEGAHVAYESDGSSDVDDAELFSRAKLRFVEETKDLIAAEDVERRAPPSDKQIADREWNKTRRIMQKKYGIDIADE